MPVLSQRALERRLKRHFLKEAHTFFAPCAPGFEAYLEAEAKALPDVQLEGKERGGVSFSGPLDTLYHANLWLRTAHRVLLRIDDFLAQSYPTLFNRVTRVPWEHYLGFSTSYTLKVSAKASRLRHHKNLAETVHSGILKALEPHGLTPELDDGAGLEVHVRMYQDRCTMSLNTSGEHLHKRGYRTHVSAAPMRETLAASLLMASRWSDYTSIFDPLCGSGTLLIEAALLATNVAPGLNRHFAFEKMPSFQVTKWERFRREAVKAQRDAELKLVGSDIDTRAVDAARVNADQAGVAPYIHFAIRDFRELTPPGTEHGLVLSNLPYGARLGSSASTKRLYAVFAEHLAETYAGWDVALIIKEESWPDDVALALQKKLEFQNGGLDVALLTGSI